MISENMKTAFMIIWWKCTDSMNAQVESHVDVAKFEEYMSLINILIMIFGEMYHYDGNNTYSRHSIDIIRNTTHSV